MQDQLDDARRRVLLRIIDWAGAEHSLDPTAPGHLRNLAAVYGVLTEQKLAENRISSFYGPDGVMQYIDALGRHVSAEVAMGLLTGNQT